MLTAPEENLGVETFCTNKFFNKIYLNVKVIAGCDYKTWDVNVNEW